MTVAPNAVGEALGDRSRIFPWAQTVVVQTRRLLGCCLWAILPRLSQAARPCCRMLRQLGRRSSGKRRAGTWLDRLLSPEPPFRWLCRSEVGEALYEYLRQGLRDLLDLPATIDLSSWFRDYRPTPRLLEALRSRTWPACAPTFTILLRLNHESAEQLQETLDSLAAQTYPRWQLLVVSDRPIPTRVRSLAEQWVSAAGRARLVSPEPQEPSNVALASALSAAQGDYVCLVDQGDFVEPQALHRFAEAALHAAPDLLYSDEITVGKDPDVVLAVGVRPAFSYDRYLSHTYFRHLLALNTALVRRAGGLGDNFCVSEEVDLVLRVLEKAKRVCHVPDILYRQREHSTVSDADRSVGEQAACSATIKRHLQRLGFQADVTPTDHPACREVRFCRSQHNRVAIIIPTKDHHELLRRCIVSLEATVPKELLQIVVVDHESREPATMGCLQDLRARHTVISYQGAFNFSAMMNHAVAWLSNEFSHFLFLNNDVEALAPGWLEHMLGLASRGDVGVVGALLLYPDRTVQHAGAVVGLHYGAGHTFTGLPAFDSHGRRAAGPDMALLATRDQSAVTGACLLIRAEVFHRVAGFDASFRVGYGDTDLCLRVRGLGYKVLLDPGAVLIHHESSTRGKGRQPHLDDTQLFRARYLQLILAGDPCHSPFWSRRSESVLNPYARAKKTLQMRTTPVVLPRS